MRKVFCLFLVVAATPTAWSETKWSKEIPGPDSPLTRERRQFGLGDWIPLTQPCPTCRPLTDPADTGKPSEDIGLTPPRPPTVTRQIHKSTFFPQDESSILSVPPPPVFNRNQITNTNARFPNFLQQFNNPNSLQFDAQPVFGQTPFLSQPFLGSTSLLGSNYPQVLPLLNNPSALLVHGNLNPAQDIKVQKVSQDQKVPNLQQNVIIEQNRQQQPQQHHVQHQQNQQVPGSVSGLQVPLTNTPVEFVPNRQQQSILEGNILTPPPVPNSTFPDIIIPGLDKEEIQLLYVPLETLKQRAQQQQQQQQQQQRQNQQQQHQHLIQQHQQQQQQQQHHQQQQQHHQQQQQHQQQPHQQHHPVPSKQSISIQQQNQVQHQQQFQHQAQHQRVTPSQPTIKFTQQQHSIRPAEHSTTPQPAGHFITHSATPTTHTADTTFHQPPVTPSTLFFQHHPFQPSQSPIVSSTPETPTLQTFLTPSTLTQKFSSFPPVSPTENLVTVPENLQFTEDFVTTPKTNVEHLTVKDFFGKDIIIDNVQHVNKFKSLSIQQQEEQQKQFLLQRQKELERQKQQEQQLLLEQQERERLHQEKLLREQQERERQELLLKEQQEKERKQKLLKEQEEKERQHKLLLEQQERERQQKIFREQQERERQQKLIREQQERERQQKLIREQQERERQQKIFREQQERERQQKLIREQQERERQQKIFREQQERERQQKLIREQQERERQQKIFREQQERERQQKLLLEQQEREKHEKFVREQQERERQQKLFLEQQEREEQEKLIREQQERERQENLLREQQEKELQQQQLLYEQQEKTRQENILREQQERELQQQQLLYEQQERARQEKLLLEQRTQELLLKQQQEREQQLLLQEQKDRERQIFLDQQHKYLTQQQLGQPLPTQFDLQPEEGPTKLPEFELQTEAPDESLVPHQPPLSVFYGSNKGQPRLVDVLKELKGAKTISVLDQYLDNMPKVFVGPANLRPPKGYGKFDLPYLSNIDVNRVERKVERLPFFVAPLNFIPPVGYSKIPFPAPHVGSVVVDSESVTRQPERGSTALPNLSTLHPRLRTTTQVPPTTHIQQIHPKLKHKVKESRFPNPPLPNPELINELKTEPFITTTVIPETTTHTRGRRPFYRTKARRPTKTTPLQQTSPPETVENSQFHKTETVERRPKFPKQRGHRVKTTTEEYDSIKSANRQYLVETSPTPTTIKRFENEEFGSEFFQQESPRTEVQGIFEVTTPKVEQTQAITETPPSHSPLTTLGFEPTAKGGFEFTTQGPSTIGRFEVTQRTPSSIDYEKFGQTDFFATTARGPSGVEIESAGFTGFYDQTPRIPVGIESNGDSGFFNTHSFSSSGVDNSFIQGQGVEKEVTPGFEKFENVFYQEGTKAVGGDGLFDQKEKFLQTEQVTEKPEEVQSTPKNIAYETNYPSSEQSTEPVRVTTELPPRKVNQDEVITHFVEVQKENEEVPQITTSVPTTIKPKTRFRTKSRGQVNFATSQRATQSPFVRKRVVYKTRKEEPYVTEDEKAVPKFRGQRKGIQASTENSGDYEGTRAVYTAKPHRRTSVAAVLRRRKPVTPLPETTSPNYPLNYEIEYSPSGVSNDVFDDQIRESSLSRSQYAQNALSFTVATTSATTQAPEEKYTRRRDDVREEQKTEEIPTENYPPNFPSEVYVADISRVTPFARTTPAYDFDRNGAEEEEEVKKLPENKKAFDPILEKKNARRRIRVRVHKRPHEHIETAESQNLGTVANALVPPTPAKPSIEPDLYRFSKTGFNFDQSERFAGTKNQAYVRNITSDILENTAAFSAPGIETETDLKRVTIVSEDKTPPVTTTEIVSETTEKPEKEETRNEGIEIFKDEAFTTTENAPIETTTDFTTIEYSEIETETEKSSSASPIVTTTTTTTTTTPATPSTTEEDTNKEVQLSTATEISHETEICFRGKCIKTNSATADDDLRKLVQSADKVLIT